MTALEEHAKFELTRAGFFDRGSDYDGGIGEAVMRLIAVHSSERHGGSSPMALSVFNRVARFEPLTPLSGDRDEWNDVGDGVLQNKRCSHVFKETKTGHAYDIEGKIFIRKSGATFTNGDSRIPVTFPYTPGHPEFVHV